MSGSAIIGCGGISALHGAALTELGLPIGACCDVLPERAEAFAQRFGGEPYGDYLQMLERARPEAVHLCLPHYLHAPVALACLERGIPVLTEKPVSILARDGARMCSLAARQGVQLGVCFQNRFNDGSRFAKEALESGELGRPLAARAVVMWHRDQAYYDTGAWRGRWETEGGGVAINQAIHTLDLLCWLLGPARSVDARIANHSIPGIEVEDTAEGTIEFPGARACFYLTNAYGADRPPEIEVLCERGSVRIEGEAAWVRKGDRLLPSPTPTAQVTPGLGKACYGNGHIRLIANFYRALRGEEPLLVTGEEGLRTQELVSGLYASARLGRPVALEGGCGA